MNLVDSIGTAISGSICGRADYAGSSQAAGTAAIPTGGDRQLLWIELAADQLPEPGWLSSLPDILAATLPVSPALWIGPESAQQVDAGGIDTFAIREHLGAEFQLVVFDATSRFDVNAFAAISGTVVGHGLMVLITPAATCWADLDCAEKQRLGVHGFNGHYSSRFLTRMVRQLQAFTEPLHRELQSRALHRQSLLRVQAQRPSIQPAAAVPPRSPPAAARQPSSTDAWQPYEQQQVLVQQLTHQIAQSLDTHSRGVWILTAHRGRGKSAALGMCAARLLEDSWRRGCPLNIPVCSGARKQVRTLFTHFHSCVEQSRESTSEDHDLTEGLTWSTAQELLASATPAPLLIIDEAATLPLPVLVRLIQHHTCVIIASTVHGYEGAGRGFALRLKEFMNRAGIPQHWLTLTHPIRWSVDDPLELFCEQALLLASELPANSGGSSSPATRGYEPVSVTCCPQPELLRNEPLLQSVFGLLVQAHYQTTPADLRHLLDGPNLSTWLIRAGSDAVGAILLAREGPIHDAALRAAILRKRRRPRGHLLPQLLAQWLLDENVLDLSVARIVRIALHPSRQNQGIGSQALIALLQQLADGTDLLGAQFGSYPQLLNFWIENQFHQFHRGYHSNASSGLRSAAVIRAVSERAKDLPETASLLFATSYATNPVDHLSAAAPILQPAMQPSNRSAIWCLPDDIAIARAFAQGARSLSDSRQALLRLWQPQSQQTTTMATSQTATAAGGCKVADADFRKILLHLVSPDATAVSLANALNLSGKRDFEQTLRYLVAQHLPRTD